MNLSEVVLLDFETRSQADLTLVGGRNYAAHPSTEVVCCCFYADGERLTWLPGDPPPPYAPVLAAHNADGFDTHVWRAQGWPEPERWIDTAAVARTAGLPGKLSELGRRFGFAMKDETGSAVTRALSAFAAPQSRRDKVTGEPIVQVPADVRAALALYHQARKANPDAWPPIPKAVLDCVVGYCQQDVAVMADVWPAIADFVDLEPEVLAVWRAANDRGIAFDSELARALHSADEREAARLTGIPLEAISDALFFATVRAAGVRVPKDPGTTWLRRLRDKVPAVSELARQRLEVSALRYHASFLERMRALGVYPGSASYEDVHPFAEHADERVRALVQARLSLASIARGKLEAGLARVSADGRMRDNVRYYGAHTGRGAGGGMQLQNFPHPEGEGASWSDDRLVAEAARAPDRPAWTQAEISALLRACMYAPSGKVLVAADFSGVEARANAYTAGDANAVATFRAGGDAYATLACRLFSIDPSAFSKKTHFIERDTSKKAELGCGYGMGPPKFVATAEKGGLRWRPASACVGAGCVDPICGARDGDATHGAETIVRTWRALHKPIVDFWYALARAAALAVADGGQVHVPADVALSFVYDAGDLALVLPSGRPVVYRRAALEAGKYGPQVRFTSAKGPARLYGGLLCENAIQAMCRDLLGHGMVQAEADGLPVVLTVHDEIVCEVEAHETDALERLIRAMCTLPAWAKDMPITAEGFVGRRYRK